MSDFYWVRPTDVTPRSSMSFMASGTPNGTIQPNCSLCVDPQDAVRMISQPCLGIGDVPIPSVATLIFTNPAADDTRSASEYVSHYSDTQAFTYDGSTPGTKHRDCAVLNIRHNLDYGTGTTEINFSLVNPYGSNYCSYGGLHLEKWYSIETGWSRESLANANSGWVPDTVGQIPDFIVSEGYTPIDSSVPAGFGSHYSIFPEASGYYRIHKSYRFTTNTLTLSMLWYRSLEYIPDASGVTQLPTNGKDWAISKTAFIATADPTFRRMAEVGFGVLAIEDPAGVNTTGSDTFSITAVLTIDGTGSVTNVTSSVSGGTCGSVDARLGL